MKEHNVTVLKKIAKCEQCFWKNDCWKQGVCNNYKPIDSDKFCENLYQYIKKNIKPTDEKKLVRHTYQTSKWGAYSDNTTLDQYYVSMINDDISELKKHHVVYVFCIDQIIELYRFLPELRILNYDNGIWYLSL